MDMRPDEGVAKKGIIRRLWDWETSSPLVWVPLWIFGILLWAGFFN